MKSALGAHCDDFHTSTRLFFKLELSLERESTLHFFDRIRREYPALKRLRRREGNTLVLEESDSDSRGEAQRWVRLEPSAMRFGHFAPASGDECREFAGFLLEQAPYHLTLTELDVDYLEVFFGFDMEYSGNHDQLVADTLFRDHPLASFIMADDCAHTIDCQPYFGIALTPKCDVQAHLEIKSRTSSYEVRTGQYDSQLLSVNLCVRRYWGFEEQNDLVKAYEHLFETGVELATSRIVPLVVNPLALAIARRP